MCQFYNNMLFNMRRSVLFILVIVLAVVETNAQEHIFNTFYIQSPLIKDSKSISSSSQSSESSSEESTEADTDITTRKPLAEVPKTTMDIITVIWYLSTFLALAAFFFLMACSDRRCGRRRTQADQLPVAPPTPAPSYSEFAPPSYESVVKQSHNIYVVPVHGKFEEKNTKDIQFHTINELQKIG